MPKVTMKFKDSNTVTINCSEASVNEECVLIEYTKDLHGYPSRTIISLDLLDSVKVEG